jgi:hypothetical protein
LAAIAHAQYELAGNRLPDRFDLDKVSLNNPS